ncbi:MAG: thiamine-phosphate kinase [Deltaproteobacteria bacterium]|nr:thiamine-phosphate kinase [Deltaproteobacteria bacterium]
MKISEFDLIQSIKGQLATAHPALLQGIGDDCAVVKKDSKNVFLISTDCLIENVHFDLKHFSFIDLGKKAIAVNLSDIAAMGGKPLYAFICLGIPPKINQTAISDFYAGVDHVSAEFGLSIAGGDMSRSPNYLFIGITVVGETPRANVKLRSAAKDGDGIYVTGTIGTAAVGLNYLKRKRPAENQYIKAIKNPRPRIAVASALAGFAGVHAMIDVSDGLLQDLHHVMKASNTQALVEVDKIPRESDFETACKTLRLDPLETLLTGGEDYQLLFTMDDKTMDALSDVLKLNRGFKITRIGEVREAAKQQLSLKLDPYPLIRVNDATGREIFVKKGGYDHFGT